MKTGLSGVNIVALFIELIVECINDSTLCLYDTDIVDGFYNQFKVVQLVLPPIYKLVTPSSLILFSLLRLRAIFHTIYDLFGNWCTLSRIHKFRICYGSWNKNKTGVSVHNLILKQKIVMGKIFLQLWEQFICCRWPCDIVATIRVLIEECYAWKIYKKLHSVCWEERIPFWKL